jgi:hypothetical protein
LEQTNRNWEMQNENETELKTEKEKMRILIHPQWGKGNYIQYGGLLNYQAIVTNYLRQTN